MKIGIFDSGIGGVSVLHEAYHLLPNENYIFYADEEHVPYGTKSVEEVQKYARQIVLDLIDRGVDAIVIACNTATSVAADMLRKEVDIPIIGMEPAVKPAVELPEILDSTEKRVLVMATPVTIREKKLQNLLERVDKKHRVDLLPMPELVNLAEHEKFDDGEAYIYLKNQLENYDVKKYEAVVLGCTHFNYFKKEYKKFFGQNIKMIDGNEGTINHLAELLKLDINNEDKELFTGENDSKTQYLISGRQANDEEIARFKRLHKKLEEVRML